MSNDNKIWAAIMGSTGFFIIWKLFHHHHEDDPCIAPNGDHWC